MTTLTTADRVLRRLGYTDPSLTTQVIDEYIEDVQAYMENECNKVWDSTDREFGLARSVCTDGAAMYCVIRPSGGLTEGLNYRVDEVQIQKDSQLRARISLAANFSKVAAKGLASLKSEPDDLPFTNTQESRI